MVDHIGDNILIPQVDNVVLIDRSDGINRCMDGTLCISGHHLILSSRQDDGQELWVGVYQLFDMYIVHIESILSFMIMIFFLQLMNRNIDVVEKKLNTQSPGGSIILKCKDFQILQLDISSTNDLINAILSIEKLISLGNLIASSTFQAQWRNCDLFCRPNSAVSILLSTTNN